MRIHPLLFGLAIVACTDDPEDPNPSGSGELGVGTFTYLCRSEGDFTCQLGVTESAFPQAFALGGRFGLRYAWKDDLDHINEPLPALQSAAPGQLQYAGDTFTALTAGYAAVLAVTGNSEVVDLIHAAIREVDDLRLVDPTMLPNIAPLTDLIVPLGGFDVQLVPLDLNDVPLSGALDVAWSLDVQGIVQITTGDGTGRVHLEALIGGEATLTATLGDRSVSLPITVDPEFEPTTGDTDDTTTILTTGDTTDTTDATGSTGDTDSSGSDSTATTADTSSESSGTTADTTGGAL